MSVCAKLQLSSWSRSGWIVCVGWGGGGEHVATMSNSNAFAELRWVLTIKMTYRDEKSGQDYWRNQVRQIEESLELNSNI